MNADHPCLIFSKNLVAARSRNNHIGKPVDNFQKDEAVIKLCGQKMQLQKIKKLINSIIKN